MQPNYYFSSYFTAYKFYYFYGCKIHKIKTRTKTTWDITIYCTGSQMYNEHWPPLVAYLFSRRNAILGCRGFSCFHSKTRFFIFLLVSQKSKGVSRKVRLEIVIGTAFFSIHVLRKAIVKPQFYLFNSPEH